MRFFVVFFAVKQGTQNFHADSRLTMKFFPSRTTFKRKKNPRIRRSDLTKKPRILRPDGRAALPCFRAEPFR